MCSSDLNYQRNCERWGTSLKVIAHDYEDNSVDEELYEKMKADGAKWECSSRLDAYTYAGEMFYPEPYLTSDDALVFVMDFIGCKIEDHTHGPIEWTEVGEDAPILIGGYGAKIERSFGYGLFYS